MANQIPALVLLAVAVMAAPAAAQSECSGAVGRFRTIVTSDAETGNLDRSVYDRMQPELTRAAALCQSGHGSEALRVLQELKNRYGYH